MSGDESEPASAKKKKGGIKWWLLFRRAHLYLGCFFTPMLVFYLLTGWYQSINNERLKHPSEAETLLQKMRTVHVDHIYPSETEFSNPSNPAFYKFLTIVMCIAAVLTIILGVALAFKTIKNRLLVALSLVAGMIIPALILWLGQGRGS